MEHPRGTLIINAIVGNYRGLAGFARAAQSNSISEEMRAVCTFPAGDGAALARTQFGAGTFGSSSTFVHAVYLGGGRHRIFMHIDHSHLRRTNNAECSAVGV